MYALLCRSILVHFTQQQSGFIMLCVDSNDFNSLLISTHVILYKWFKIFDCAITGSVCCYKETFSTHFNCAPKLQTMTVYIY